jgi:2'-hydroxyisoflavone reductase
MKLLIIGGTVFVGRHLTEAALARGHEVTLFNRGQHNPGMFPHVHKLKGDRDGDLDALLGQSWDAVIDTCGYVPRIVKQSVKALAGSVPLYTFISTISVYGDFTQVGMDETAPIGILEDATIEEVTGKSYGPLKALCEEAVKEDYPEQHLIVRPGLIVGPHDPTDRFTYWPTRMFRGGEVLAPGNPEQPVQWIDVRDLTEWIIRMVEQHKTGTYNATGPAEPLTMEGFLETCRESLQPDAKLTWVNESFLLEQGVGPWMEMPLWVPENGESPMPGLHTIRCNRAIAQGLTFRPITETVVDTLTWDQQRDPEPAERRAGMKPEREIELLALWKDSI